MPIFEWEGIVRVTIGSLSRTEKLELWREYTSDEWLNREPDESGKRDPLENTIFLMKTDAMIGAAATRKIEICKNGKWVSVKKEESVVHDGETFMLHYPITADDLNSYPASLADQWIEVATSKNGGISSNLTFFTSLRPTNGKTNKEDTSE